jgi:hypothetical protein
MTQIDESKLDHWSRLYGPMVLSFITAKRFFVAYFQTILKNVLKAKQIILKKKWPVSLALIHWQLSLVVSSHIYGDNVGKTKFVKHVFLNLYLVRYDLFHTLLHKKKVSYFLSFHLMCEMYNKTSLTIIKEPHRDINIVL